MSSTPVSAGFLPLVDAAPLIVALELGFAEEEGLALSLTRAPSWSGLRDLLAFGQVDAASMLSPVPVASALGLGGLPARIDALMVTSLGGEAVAASLPLAAKMRMAGYSFDFADANAARDSLRAVGEPLRIGIPFPFSMHAELLYRWLGEAIDVHTVPPPMMADAVAAGDVDLFIVGEPWGSVAVERGVGQLLLPGTAIWPASPNKVLAMRHEQVEADPDLTGGLMRAVWRACRWLALPENRLATSEILARPAYLDLSSEIIERILSGRVVVSPDGEERSADRIVEFFSGCATFPWRSQAEWIGDRLAARHGLEPAAARRIAREVFRSDLYRQHLGPAGADLPAASSRLEGAVKERGLHPAAQGRVMLLPDAFFDRAIFDPDLR
ncbi:ABC transporter substrate-binding protein [Cereibacter changlensis]|uniref:ABC transporter substrate-binding protein n=1 Tax=Cereibacter changlensis TaxID=402884 RepID=A0A4U0Z0N5_9RHOB|nr:CmpA/NrtA family ABC transporter substrate-binding protein [Cereibacter changlensis]TKA97745.1 ABC transporter substrate-binding protein [Cereibacter changlensis]